MTFTGGIPMSGQSLGQTRDAIRNNFTNYFDAFSVNHIQPNGDGTYPQGKHKFSEYVVQAQSPATSTAEVAEYSRAIAGIAQLFLQKENQLAGASDIQMSRVDTGVLSADPGYSFLPGGTIIQWGTDAFVGTAVSRVVTFPIPFTANAFTAYAFPVGFNNIFHGDTLTLTNVNISRNAGTGANQNFWWLAIGN